MNQDAFREGLRSMLKEGLAVTPSAYPSAPKQQNASPVNLKPQAPTAPSNPNAYGLFTGIKNRWIGSNVQDGVNNYLTPQDDESKTDMGSRLAGQVFNNPTVKNKPFLQQAWGFHNAEIPQTADNISVKNLKPVLPKAMQGQIPQNFENPLVRDQQAWNEYNKKMESWKNTANKFNGDFQNPEVKALRPQIPLGSTLAEYDLWDRTGGDALKQVRQKVLEDQDVLKGVNNTIADKTYGVGSLAETGQTRISPTNLDLARLWKDKPGAVLGGGLALAGIPLLLYALMGGKKQQQQQMPAININMGGMPQQAGQQGMAYRKYSS